MTDDLRLHGSLIGRAARDRLNTPALVLDRDALDRNITRMAEFARSHRTALRPHAKTHKSVDIAHRQLAAGASGVCCAKLGEAEALADGGIRRLLITSPVVPEPAIRRLAELHRRCDELITVVDHPANASALATAASAPGASGTSRPLDVLIDIDPGIHRTGVASPAAALELAQRIRALPQLRYRGVQFYCGVQQHIAGFAEREAAIRERMQYLQSVIALLTEHRAAPAIITGAGTGTHRIDAALGLYTEWQVGSYVFMDRQYAECELDGDGAALFEYALFVETTVVSANHRGLATIDAGFKALATDGGPPVIVSGAPGGASYRFMGDEHGAIVDPAGAHVWQLGDRVRLAVPHCDPTVNLYDSYHVLSGDTLEAIWPVTARGRSR